MSKPVILYHNPFSPFSRLVLMTARAVGADVEVKTVDLMKGEHRTEEYRKLNPTQKVPTLVDGDFVLYESRAIATYLAGKYGKDNLYPKDLKKRAIVDQRLYFDATNLTARWLDIVLPIFTNGDPTVTEDKKNNMNATLALLEGFLEKSKWLAGDHFTVADISIYATVASLEAIGWDLSAYANLKRWLKSCSSIPGYDEAQAATNAYGQFLRGALKNI